jgi:enediyne biosynthesis thioesterase
VHSYEYRHRVLLEDTNLVGNVYFTRYLGWQGRCWEGFLADHAPELGDARAAGVALITTQCSCDYLAEATPGDTVSVRMRTVRLARTLVTVVFEHWLLEDGRSETLLARGEHRLACVRRERAQVVPAAFPDSLRRALERCSACDCTET